MLDNTFSVNVAKGGTATASNIRNNDRNFSPANVIDEANETYWATNDIVHTGSFTIEWKQPREFNCIMLQEYIPLGQRVEAFSVETWNGSEWSKIADGTTIGNKRLLKIPDAATSRIRLNITKSKASPVISNFGLFKIP